MASHLQANSESRQVAVSRLALEVRVGKVMLRSKGQLEGWAIDLMSLLRSRKTLWQPPWAEGVFSSPSPRVAINHCATRAYCATRLRVPVHRNRIIYTLDLRWLSSSGKLCKCDQALFRFSGRGLGTRLRLYVCSRDMRADNVQCHMSCTISPLTQREREIWKREMKKCGNEETNKIRGVAQRLLHVKTCG